MPTEQEVSDIIEMGRACEALKKNVALERVFSETIGRLFAEWCNTPGDLPDQMGSIHATMKAVREVKDTLDGFINNGQLEVAQREHEYNNYK